MQPCALQVIASYDQVLLNMNTKALNDAHMAQRESKPCTSLFYR